MKPFNLKQALANPKKVCTRNREKRVFAMTMDCITPNHQQPLIVRFDDDTTYTYRYYADGRFYHNIDGKDCIWDLMMED